MLGIAILLIFIFFIFFFRGRTTPEHKGIEGELKVHKILCQLPEEYTIFNDVVLKTYNGTTQIDHIVVSKYGIFAIETKNYRGIIYGNDDRQEWTQIIKTDVRYMKKWYKTYTYIKKSKFYNPVKQSISHSNALHNNLKYWPNLTIIPIVVFAGDASIENVTSKHIVIYDDFLLDTILNFNTPCISNDELNNIVSYLSQINIRDAIDDNTHIKNVYATKQYYNNKITSGICPACGGKLLLRNGKYGNFYGCSNYPNCKFTTE